MLGPDFGLNNRQISDRKYDEQIITMKIMFIRKPY
jgi:hypothetical protein